MHNVPMREADSRSAARLLVSSDRADAEHMAQELTQWTMIDSAPEVLREALAGEDDADDAQWLVAIEPPSAGWAPDDDEDLLRLVERFDAWVETAE